MRKYLLPILLIGFWSCEDSESNEPEPKVLSGIWEWRYYYDSEESSWSLYSEQPRNYPFNTWAFIDESSFRERWFLTDYLCYSDWNTYIDSTSIFRLQFIGEDSLSIMWRTEDDNPDNDNGVSYKAVEDSLYYTENGINGLSTLMYKAIRIDTLDFTPLCND